MRGSESKGLEMEPSIGMCFLGKGKGSHDKDLEFGRTLLILCQAYASIGIALLYYDLFCWMDQDVPKIAQSTVNCDDFLYMTYQRIGYQWKGLGTRLPQSRFDVNCI